MPYHWATYHGDPSGAVNGSRYGLPGPPTAEVDGGNGSGADDGSRPSGRDTMERRRVSAETKTSWVPSGVRSQSKFEMRKGVSAGSVRRCTWPLAGSTSQTSWLSAADARTGMTI